MCVRAERMILLAHPGSADCWTCRAISSCARFSETLGFNRPTRGNGCRAAGLGAGNCNGAQISAGSSSPGGNENVCGITPTTFALLPFTWITRLRMPRSPANARCHKSCESTTTIGAPGTSSCGVIARPNSGDTPSDGNSPPVTDAEVTRIGSAAPARFTPPTIHASSDSQDDRSRFSSSYSGGEVQKRRSPPFGNFGNSVYKRTSPPGSRYPSGRSSTACTTLKMALVAPMPSARQITAAAVNPDFWQASGPHTGDPLRKWTRNSPPSTYGLREEGLRSSWN